jgi:hypothetical protein
VTGDDDFDPREARRCSELAAAPPPLELVTIALGSFDSEVVFAAGGCNGGDEIAGLLADEVEEERVPTAAWDVDRASRPLDVEGEPAPLGDRTCGVCRELGGVLEIAPVAEIRKLFTVLLSAWKTETPSPHGRPDTPPALVCAIVGLVGETGEEGSLPSFAWLVNVECIDESDSPRRRSVRWRSGKSGTSSSTKVSSTSVRPRLCSESITASTFLDKPFAVLLIVDRPIVAVPESGRKYEDWTRRAA